MVARVAQAPVASAKPRKATAKKGAKRRAVASLVGKKKAASMTDAELFAFWDPHLSPDPPPLRTSFGNYTCINSVSRFTLTTRTSESQWVWIPWTPSALAALYGSGAASSTMGYATLGALGSSSGVPQSIRPLRLSAKVENITQLVNEAGSVRTLSVDNPIYSSWLCGATVSTNCQCLVGLDSLLSPLVDGSPLTVENPATALCKQHTFVSVPAAYPAYNTYYDFISLTSSGAALNSGDMFNLLQGYYNDNTAYASGTYFSGTSGSAGLGGLPPMRAFLFYFPATPTAQTYRFEIRRQDGCRYPVNSLGAAFSRSGPSATSAAEDFVHGMISAISNAPSQGMEAARVAAKGFATRALTNSLEKMAPAAVSRFVAPAVRMAATFV